MALLGPPWLPKRPQGMPIWLIIMCYTFGPFQSIIGRLCLMLLYLNMFISLLTYFLGIFAIFFRSQGHPGTPGGAKSAIFGLKQRLTGSNKHKGPLMLWKGPNGPETLFPCMTHNYKSYWDAMGLLSIQGGPKRANFGLKQRLNGRN